MGKKRRFQAISECENGRDSKAIMDGSWYDCLLACARDDAPCYVVEVFIDEDGNEFCSDHGFKNRAWIRKYLG